jgi:hypothetical protein
MSKILDSEVSEIRDEYARGVLTQQMLGDVYGVSFQAISKIVTGTRR